MFLHKEIPFIYIQVYKGLMYNSVKYYICISESKSYINTKKTVQCMYVY